MAAKYTAEDAIQMLDESFETANTDSDYEEGGDNSGASDSTHTAGKLGSEKACMMTSHDAL